MYTTNKEIISDILADITYASAHWVATIKNSIPEEKLTGPCVEDKWFNCLLIGGSLTVYTIDDEKFTINFKDLSKAVSKVRKMDCFKDENGWDCNFADCILQYACFDELVYD